MEFKAAAWRSGVFGMPARSGLAAALVAALVVSPGFGQGTSQPGNPPSTQPAKPASELDSLRSENAQLKQRVTQLERELQAANNTIAALRRSRTTDRVVKTAAEIPNDPLAAPAAMREFLRRSYASELGQLQEPKDEPTLRLRAQRWVRDIEKETRGKASWLVRFQRVDALGAGNAATLRAMTVVIEEKSELPIGDPFPLDVPASFVGRVKDAKPDQQWQLGLTFAARPRFNPQRAEAGSPDVPPFVGKYVEVEYEYRWESLNEVKVPATPAPGASPASPGGAR